MFLLIPTCDANAFVLSATLPLLDRYWRTHPEAHVLHHAIMPVIDARNATAHDCGPQDRSSWLETMTRFLSGREEEQFLLLLDDYALCGPAREDLICSGLRLLQSDPTVGLFPLCWYPAARREPRPGQTGIITLRGAPILLQACLWRKSWFMELAEAIGGRATPWSFEAAASRAARKRPMDICMPDIPEPAYRGGDLVDGFDKADWPLPYHNLLHRGQRSESHERFLAEEGLSLPSRGLGDTIARVSQVTGISGAMDALAARTGHPCGCARRRRRLNRWVSYGRRRAHSGLRKNAARSSRSDVRPNCCPPRGDQFALDC
jgi:hypothetical protein